MFQVKLEKVGEHEGDEEQLESEVLRDVERRMRSGQFTAQPLENAEAFSCKMCKAKYLSRAHLELHIQEKHTTKGGWLHCQLCEYKFRKAPKLSEHMVACHGQGTAPRQINEAEEHACQLCSFSCTTSFNLVQHLSKEHTERPQADGQFTCGSCSFRAETLNAVKSHRYLTHFQRNLEQVGFDITKLLSCIVCSGQFANEASLRSHLLARHRMEPTIPGIGRQSSGRGAPRHFPCQHCGKGFVYLGKLEAHERIVHNVLPSQVHAYCCSTCNFKPVTVFGLEVHRRKAHGEGGQPAEQEQSRPVEKKPEVPLDKMKFSNSLLKFRSTEGLPSGALQPLSTLAASLKQPRPAPSGELPPRKKMRTDKPVLGPRLPGPILACTLCTFRCRWCRFHNFTG
jgi:hypothetical protein